MKIYLLHIDGRGPVFYSEGPESIAEVVNSAPERGLRGRIERKYRDLQLAIRESEQGVGARMRRAWEWLHRRTSPDESLLRHLRSATAIEIFHPATITQEETRAAWGKYLASRQRRHIWWFIINFLISPLTILLVPIPGPNIIGYWFVYRAVCHFLALLGIRQATSGQITTAFYSSSALDTELTESPDERTARIAAMFGLKDLDGFIKRNTVSREGTRGTPLPVQ